MKEYGYINSAAGGSNIGRLAPNGLYLNPNQSRDRVPTTYENILADAIERAYAAGIHDLDNLVNSVNDQNCLDPDGQTWTEDRFVNVLSELAV